MTSPIWASDLLRTADKLAPAEAGRGRPALCDLRRATSTAYYALFHQVIRHSALHAVPGATEDDIANVSRWHTHAGVRRASEWVIRADENASVPKEARAAVTLLQGAGTPIPRPLLTVANTFVSLQDARHDADYSNQYDPVRFTTREHVQSADLAVRATWSMWRARTSTRSARQELHAAYSRFLSLALVASGGPRVR